MTRYLQPLGSTPGSTPWAPPPARAWATCTVGSGSSSSWTRTAGGTVTTSSRASVAAHRRPPTGRPTGC